MFWRLYKYRLKRLINDKIQLFWLAIFPIVLGTLFYMAFSDISKQIESLDAFSVAVVNEESYRYEEGLNAFLDAISTEGGIMKLVAAADRTEAEQLLKDEKVVGVLIISQELQLVIHENGMNQTILKNMIDRYLEGEAVINDAAATGDMTKVQAAAAALYSTEELNVEKSAASGEMDPFAQYFFALMAMTCLFGATMGVINTNEVQADQTKVAARRQVSPTKKSLSVLTDLLAAFTVQYAVFLILYFYLTQILKISFGSNLGYLLLAGAAASLNGISFGYFAGVYVRGKSSMRDAIVNAAVLGSSFLAGLMMMNIKHMIEKTAPIVNRINPASLIADCFYYLGVYDDKKRYAVCIVTLLAETVVLGVLSAIKLKKARYHSL